MTFRSWNASNLASMVSVIAEPKTNADHVADVITVATRRTRQSTREVCLYPYVGLKDEITSTTSLLNYLRNHLQLRGTKYMCLEGGCGACIVAVVKPSGGPIQAVNACLVSITSCQGWEITTIEKIGNRMIGYHPLQTTLAKSHGSQCGYCSPGFIMAMYSLFKSKSLTMLEVETSLGSNVCRCTGYRPILDAMKKFASDAPKLELPDIEDLKICKNNGEVCDKERCDEMDWCFVSEDEVLNSVLNITLSDGREWYIVTDTSEIFTILNKKPNNSYMLVAGNTSKGVYPRDENPQILIDISRVQGLKGYKLDQNLVLGAGNTLTETLDIFHTVGSQQYFSYLKTVIDHMNYIAHIPIRNIGTIAGNLMIKHDHNEFQSDIYLLLNAVGAYVTIMTSATTTKTVSMASFLTETMKGKIILNILLPPLSEEYKLVTYKIMPRAQNAHAFVNSGFLYKLNAQNIVEDCRIVYGGLSPSFNRAPKTEDYLKTRNLFVNETLKGAIKTLSNEILVTYTPPEPFIAYRKQLAIGLFYKSLLYLCPSNIVSPRYTSGAINLKQSRGVSSGKRDYDTDPTLYPLNEPIQKVEALIQCAGEAIYAEDIPSLPNEVFAALCLTTVGLGTIQKIDATTALKQPGVLAFYTAKDIPGLNSFTPAGFPFYLANEELLCSGEVKYYNQPFGIIVAESQHAAEVAAKVVNVTYSNTKSPVTDVKVAKTDTNRVSLSQSIDVTNPGSNVTKIIKGNNTILTQYHFCMETLVCVSKPSEEGLDIYPASQWLDGIQLMTSRMLNINSNRINVIVKRIGGAYGMKVSRANQTALACNLVAYKMNRPCRLIQSLITNMRAVGKRLPCSTDYEIAIDDNGVVQYINEQLYADHGYIVDEDIILLGIDAYYNCYDKSKWNYKAYNVVTDTPSNTFTRAPGTLEGIAMAETIMERIAYTLSLDPIDIRLANVDPTKKTDVLEMVNTLKETSLYVQRKAEVANFNVANRWKKQGLGVALMNWRTTGSSYLTVNLSVYHGDGTVAIAHGGIEMGQAINTKAAQVCAYLLKIPVEKVQIKANDSTITPNCFITAGSIASQNVAVGVRRCCEQLLERLAPIRAQMDNPTWKELIEQAFNSDVDLQVHAFAGPTEGIPYDIYGFTIAQITMDVITGEWSFDRVDIIEDVGQSVSPEMDVGQVEGAYIMGVGYNTTEEIVYDSTTGENLTNRTWNYWVPQARDIPLDFRVSFRKKSFGLKTFFGAKATGEPATCMAISVPFALRQAFTSARKEAGFPTTEWLQIDGPYTVEKICLAAATNVDEFSFN